MSSSPNRISQRVDNYIRYRPRYPSAVLELLKSECGLTQGQIIADVGTGTGILAELFLADSFKVIGIEPDAGMRAGAEFYLQSYVNFVSVDATAEATTLADHSVDFVTAGQAFHWFDRHLARPEFERILKPRGWVVLAWNVQRTAGTPFLVALHQFWEDGRYWNRSRSRQSAQQIEQTAAIRRNPDLLGREMLDQFFAPGAYSQQLFDNPLACDFEALKGRVLSNGTAPEPGDAQYRPMLAALEDLFSAYQENGRVTIEQDTLVAYGQLPVKS